MTTEGVVEHTPKETVFRVTFGVQYRTERHPVFEWITPDGYVIIVAKDEPAARAKAHEVFGDKWAFIYDYLDIENGRFNPGSYPEGALAVVFA